MLVNVLISKSNPENPSRKYYIVQSTNGKTMCKVTWGWVGQKPSGCTMKSASLSEVTAKKLAGGKYEMAGDDILLALT